MNTKELEAQELEAQAESVLKWIKENPKEDTWDWEMRLFEGDEYDHQDGDQEDDQEDEEDRDFDYDWNEYYETGRW